jgi:hypothetical protein
MLQRHGRTSAAESEHEWAFALPAAAAAQAGRLLERLGDSRRGLQRRGVSAAAAPSAQAPPRRRAAPLFATMSASADAVVNRRRNGAWQQRRGAHTARSLVFVKSQGVRVVHAQLVVLHAAAQRCAATLEIWFG